jgi:multicomponent Na+:H+ antiporter subunit G
MSLFDEVAAVLVVASAVLALSAAVGLSRFPDLFTRMHAAAKPQTLGVLLALAAIGLAGRDPSRAWMLLAIAVFQLMTVPVSAHLVGRRAFRTLPSRHALLTEVPDRPLDEDADRDCGSTGG